MHRADMDFPGYGGWISESDSEDISPPRPLSPLATPSSIGKKGKRVLQNSSGTPNKIPYMHTYDSIPEWAQVLEPIRTLPTNVGSRIRKCVNEALARNPPKLARAILEHSISEGVYKGNASGITKNLAIAMLAYARVENNQSNEVGPSTVAEYFEVNNDDCDDTIPKWFQEQDDDDDVIPKWVQALEPMEELNENLEGGIRAWINGALEKNPPVWAKDIMEYSIRDGVYIDCDLGQTKRAIIRAIVIARPRCESGPILSLSGNEGISLRKLVFNVKKKVQVISVDDEAHLELNSFLPMTELDIMKSRVDELQKVISKLQKDAVEELKNAKKDAIEEFKNSDEFHQEIIKAVTQQFMNGNKS